MKKNKIIILCISILIITFILFFINKGYAYLTANLKVNSKITIDGSGWDLYFKDYENSNENIYDITFNNENSKEPIVNFHVDLVNPEDQYSFYVNVVNNGSVDAIVDEIKYSELSDDASKYLTYSVSYYDDVTISSGDLYASQDSDKIKITINYLKNSEIDYDNIEKSFDLSVSISFKEKEELSKKRLFNLTKNVKANDIIYYKAANENYDIMSSLSGTESDQSISLTSLYLWKVLNVNEDGTINVISEYASDQEITFKGELGYKNYVGILNDVARQYEDYNYIIDSRMFGYSTQTPYLTDVTNGNDELYQSDYTLVNSNLNKLSTTTKDNVASSYYIASRYYNENGTYGIRYINDFGIITNESLYDGKNELEINNKFRPILTLKNDILVEGKGTNIEPYKFN